MCELKNYFIFQLVSLEKRSFLFSTYFVEDPQRNRSSFFKKSFTKIIDIFHKNNKSIIFEKKIL